MPNCVTSIFALFAAGLIGCSGAKEPSPVISSSAATAPSKANSSESGEIPYPRVVATHVHKKDGEIIETGSPVVPKLVEQQFSKIDWTKPASLGVQINADTSLTISSSPREDDVERHMLAVWRRPETESEDITVCVVRHSEPFENKEQAIALLLLFVNDSESVESSLKWTVKSRGSASNPEK